MTTNRLGYVREVPSDSGEDYETLVIGIYSTDQKGVITEGNICYYDRSDSDGVASRLVAFPKRHQPLWVDAYPGLAAILCRMVIAGPTINEAAQWLDEVGAVDLT